MNLVMTSFYSSYHRSASLIFLLLLLHPHSISKLVIAKSSLFIEISYLKPDETFEKLQQIKTNPL
ncbi:hypothetical protein SAMN05216419_10098 [Nitrosomonas cryotolerans]|uniref:Uncharacterized protein n=1 Tax=Nitrosomonas cryotolerans ATCC 49181 TaxID=1131553 RepID=A0A1N6IDK4_9PROT|nr:hypothetical protein SAMN05216419_10098 [Nitrosomonas cryotolerans]SIO30025.1 hypothetical protein SAMN02743940_1730 [Nitrosomonas cryotolerans ATCC 49181]